VRHAAHPGYLEAGIRPVTSPGLAAPWFSTPGNHDALPGGCLAPEDPQLRDVVVRDRKLMTVPDADVAAFAKVLISGDDPKSTVLKDILTRNAAKCRTVTPDPGRRLFTPHPHATASRSFGEVNTASHVDYPHHARLLELVDNHDGTVSLFTTLIESSAPYRTDPGDLSQTGLASPYREFSYNAPGLPEAMSGGVRESSADAARDRNTELLVRRA
jgi:hypothetical protein